MMSFEIGEIHPNTPHLFADLAELLLLTNYFGRKSVHKNDLESILNNGSISPEEIDLEAETEAEAESIGLPTAQRNDKIENQLEDVLTQLRYREKALEGSYPFYVTNEQISLAEDLTNKQRIYRLLLACSRLRSFQKKGIRQKWASLFVKTSQVAMESLLPSSATIRVFDANSDDRRSYYSTDLRKALKVLGNDLGVRHDEEECQKASPQGDAGFDLIGTLPFEDGAAVNYAILGQCGAQEKAWPSKTLEAHSIQLRNYFKVLFDYPSVMFTPVCYRSSTGEWVSNNATNGILLADRIRIINLIDKGSAHCRIVNTASFSEFENEFLSIKID